MILTKLITLSMVITNIQNIIVQGKVREFKKMNIFSSVHKKSRCTFLTSQKLLFNQGFFVWPQSGAAKLKAVKSTL